jgi:hypothetical protein
VVYFQKELYFSNEIPPIDRSFVISFELEQYRYVFSIEKFGIFSFYKGIDHAIDLLLGIMPPYRPIYLLSPQELQILREYLDDLLKKKRIRLSKSPIRVFILFVPKKDDNLRLYIDYRRFNLVMVKNRYLLSFISEILDRIVRVQFFTKIDIKDAYHCIRIKEGDE